MSDIAIKVSGLGKQYRRGVNAGPRYRTLRDTLTKAALVPYRFIRHGKLPRQNATEKFWALRDVSFEIKQGEVVGMLGRNGAGKSTLLKLLSRITEPTEGRAELRGRVGSLLEVGTGFHPELTGRENIFLNGAILGMRHWEIEKKFDEIVDFAEVTDFLDTPVKFYSSGMHARLAFAVAAHLEPDIILVDEVLAVGDIAFQKKCLGKMSDVAQQGRTVMFVTHQMNQIRRLCNRCIWLQAGKIHDIGPTVEIVSRYEQVLLTNNSSARTTSTGSSTKFLNWDLISNDSLISHQLSTFGDFRLRFHLHVVKKIKHGHHGLALFNAENQLIWGTAADNVNLEPGTYSFTYDLPYLPIKPGNYNWDVSMYDEIGLVDRWFSSPSMIVATDPHSHRDDTWAGILNFPYSFQYSKISEPLVTNMIEGLPMETVDI